MFFIEGKRFRRWSEGIAVTRFDFHEHEYTIFLQDQINFAASYKVIRFNQPVAFGL